jgi:hypothetical protein
MRNFLEESRKEIEESGHTPDDIVFIGSEESGHQCSFDEFCQLADFNYDYGYGACKIAKDLVIVFSDGQKMIRQEYDGSEWWDILKPFSPPSNNLPIRSLLGGLDGLRKHNDPGKIK